MPQVSVIIPTYNRATVLTRAIDSVASQSFTDWELIVVDDGSTDNTREVVERYAAQGIAIRYIRQNNKKQAAARNLGIRNALGRYLAFLDSDDAWLPDKLQQQVAMLEQNPDVGMVYGNQLMVVDENDSGKLRYPQGWLESGHVFGDLLRRRFYCSTQTVLVRKTVLDEVGPFDEQFANALEDWELTLRIAWRHRVACIDEPLVRRYENTSYSREYALTRARNHGAILKKTFANCSVPRKEQKLLLKGAWFSWGRSLLEAGYYPRSIACFSQALCRGHRFAAPALLLSLLGPIGRRVYGVLRRR